MTLVLLKLDGFFVEGFGGGGLYFFVILNNVNFIERVRARPVGKVHVSRLVCLVRLFYNGGLWVLGWSGND